VPRSTNDLKNRLARYRQIKVSVIGRKSGQTISIPVWFVFEGENLYLLPVKGSDTQWYKNVLQNPSIRIDARAEETGCMARVEDHLGAIGYAVNGIPKALLRMSLLRQASIVRLQFS
jgi:deazaflavin-dependent oxidoreductase (nitroreductase family)